MYSQKIIFVFTLLASLILVQHVTDGVVNNNNGQNQNNNNEETIKSLSEAHEEEKSKNTETDLLIAESSEISNRREAAVIHDSYGPPPSSSVPSGGGGGSLPVPVYGVPNAPSNNIIYPAPPPDIPPLLPKLPQLPIYGVPNFGKPSSSLYDLFGNNNKGYNSQTSSGLLKYGAPSYSFNHFAPKPIYGPPKSFYGPPSKPLKFHNKYPIKNNYGIRPPKPIYGTPISFKDNHFNYNNNNKYSSNIFNSNSYSNLYSGISTLNHQYGVPVLPPKPQYGPPSVQYGVPEQAIATITAYGPPQPSSNPKPPHPGAPAPPTPPDIKYDGWQPIPGLVSKRPAAEELHHHHHHQQQQHVTGEGSGYHDLAPPPLNNQISDSYGPPPAVSTAAIGHLNPVPGLSDSYGVPLKSVTGNHHGVISDSYSAPLGTVTGSGGVVTSSGVEAHGGGGGGASSHQHSSDHNINLDLSSVGIGQNSDIQAVKSIEYDISPPQHQNSNSYAQQNSYSQNDATIGLVPPSGVYGAPPNTQYGTPLYTNSLKPPSSRPFLYANKGSSSSSSSSLSNSYLPSSPPVIPSTTYGVPNSNNAISYQNLAHGSSSAGLDYQQNALSIDGANALPLTSYGVPLGAIDGSYSLPLSANNDNTVSLDFSHPPVTIDLTQGKHNNNNNGHDCFNNNNHQQIQIPSVSYGVPSSNSYTASLSSLTTNLGNSHTQSIVSPIYGTPDLISSSQLQVPLSEPSNQYGAPSVPDLVHSSSIKSESKINAINNEAVIDHHNDDDGNDNDHDNDEESHGKSYGKSVAASIPNSELVESQSIDLNNISLQGNLGSYTLQIQSADESGPNQVPHTQVLNNGLLQSILQAIEQPGKQGENPYPIILQPSVEQNYPINETLGNIEESNSQQASEIQQIVVEAPKNNNNANSEVDGIKNENNSENEENLQLLESNIALYFRKDDDKTINTDNNNNNEEKAEDNTVDNESN